MMYAYAASKQVLNDFQCTCRWPYVRLKNVSLSQLFFFFPASAATLWDVKNLFLALLTFGFHSKVWLACALAITPESTSALAQLYGSRFTFVSHDVFVCGTRKNCLLVCSLSRVFAQYRFVYCPVGCDFSGSHSQAMAHTLF